MMCGHGEILRCAQNDSLGSAARDDHADTEQVKGVRNMAVTTAIIGGSGYAGGELLRLLLDHPMTRSEQVTSERNRREVRAFRASQSAQADRAQVRRAARISSRSMCSSSRLPHGVVDGARWTRSAAKWRRSSSTSAPISG